jgi:ornithine carbamoyltransferase
MNLKGKNFLKLLDYSEEEIRYLLDLAKKFKAMKKNNIPHKYLEGKNIVLLFEKTSTRTRCSFEVAGLDLGMGVTYLDAASSQMGKKESIEDTAKVLGRLYDGIEYRGYDQEIVELLARYSGVPTWNGLTTEFHPTQMIGDLLTIEEHFGHLKGLNFTFVGDSRNNVANSLMVACAKMGINYTCLAPAELYPSELLIKTCKEIAIKNGSTINITSDLTEGVTDANVIYTDVWVSMGEPEEMWEKRINLLFGILGGLFLTSLKLPPIYLFNALGGFRGSVTDLITDVVSLIGLVFVVYFSSVFIIDALKALHKK